MQQGSRFLNPYDRLAIGTEFNLFFEVSNDLLFGTSSSSALSVTKP